MVAAAFGAPPAVSLPAGSAGVTVTFRDDRGERCESLSAVRDFRFDVGPPVRAVRAFKGQRNFAGEWWSATTGGHVGFESWVERDRLMELDYVADVVAIASQPFRLDLFVGDRTAAHTPDYFVRHADGTGRVIDVRPDELVDDAAARVFAATAEVCTGVGWRYSRLGALDAVFAANLRWIAGYRHGRCLHPSVADAVTTALADNLLPIGVLADRVGSRIAVLPTVFHLIWSHRIHADLRRGPLHLGSPVRAA